MTAPQPSQLGSLSQSARSKQLNTARGILLFIGILTVVVNGIFFSMVERNVNEEFDKEVNKLRAQGMQVDQVELKKLKEQAIHLTRLIQGGAIALGVLFIIFGLMVKSYPVPITVMALVLYIGAAVVFGVIDPSTLARGLLIKILIVVGLVKSVQAAVAYQREEQAQVEEAFANPDRGGTV